MEYGIEVQNVAFKLIEEFKNNKIRQKYGIQIFTNNEWLSLSININSNSTFLELIIENWMEETKQNQYLEEDIVYIKQIKRIFYKYFYNKIFNEVQTKMKDEFETNYASKLKFELFWRGRKYNIKVDCQDDFKFPEKIHFNEELIDEIKLHFIVKDIELYTTSLAAKNYLTRYLYSIYKRTPGYKLKNMYN